MARAALVAGLLLLIVGIPVAIYAPLLDCPECDPNEDCLRCKDSRLAPFARIFDRPTHPAILDLLRDRPDPEIRIRALGGAELLTWEDDPDAFGWNSTIPLPDGTLLVGIGYEGMEDMAGTPCRILLFARNGELRHRLDLWLEAPTRQELGLRSGVHEIRLHLSELRSSKVARSPNLVLRRAHGEEIRRPIPPSGAFDPGAVTGREGRLVFVGP